MWIERQDKSTYKSVLRNFFICGGIFNLFAFFGCIFTNYNDEQKNSIKKYGAFFGVLLNTGLILIVFGASRCVLSNIALGIPLILIGAVLVGVSICLFIKKRKSLVADKI